MSISVSMMQLCRHLRMPKSVLSSGKRGKKQNKTLNYILLWFI